VRGGRAKDSEEKENSMQIAFLSVLTLLAIASPAAALLADLEPSNNSMSTATIQLVPSGGAVVVDGGRLSLFAGGGDIDFIGIGNLIDGDVVTITTTPMVDAPDFEHPDTIVGLFDSTERDLCIGDDAANNDLDNFPKGFGSLCPLRRRPHRRGQLHGHGDRYRSPSRAGPAAAVGCWYARLGGARQASPQRGWLKE